jgi:serine/threonine protein kinase
MISLTHIFVIYAQNTRDLKPTNILVTDFFKVKLADFGLSAMDVDYKTKMVDVVGTRPYMAPEMLAEDSTGYTRAIDWWAFGVVMFEMVEGRVRKSYKFKLTKKQFTLTRLLLWQAPFGIADDEETVDAILKSEPRYSTNLDATIADFLKKVRVDHTEPDREMGLH